MGYNPGNYSVWWDPIEGRGSNLKLMDLAENLLYFCIQRGVLLDTDDYKLVNGGRQKVD